MIDIELLRKVSFFKGLPATELQNLAGLMRLKVYDKHETIFREGDLGDALFIIKEGKAKVVVRGEDGSEIVISIMTNGDFFGEMSLFSDLPRSADVVSMEYGEFWVLSKNDFLSLIGRSPALAIGLLRELSYRLKVTTEKLENIALHGVEGQIENTLIQLAEKHGIEVDEGILIPIKLTHRDIAEMCGTTRETVTRNLKKLADKGSIKIESKQIILYNKMIKPQAH